jgi:uncharacterized integral membrane protein
MRYVVLLVIVILVVLLSTFGIQNPFPVNIRFLGLETGGVPLYIVIMISAVAGIIMTLLAGLPGRIQRGIELRRLRTRVADVEKELADAKSRLPPPVMKPLPNEQRVS